MFKIFQQFFFVFQICNTCMLADTVARFWQVWMWQRMVILPSTIKELTCWSKVCLSIVFTLIGIAVPLSTKISLMKTLWRLALTKDVFTWMGSCVGLLVGLFNRDRTGCSSQTPLSFRLKIHLVELLVGENSVDSILNRPTHCILNGSIVHTKSPFSNAHAVLELGARGGGARGKLPIGIRWVMILFWNGEKMSCLDTICWVYVQNRNINRDLPVVDTIKNTKDWWNGHDDWRGGRNTGAFQTWRTGTDVMCSAESKNND